MKDAAKTNLNVADKRRRHAQRSADSSQLLPPDMNAAGANQLDAPKIGAIETTVSRWSDYATL